MKKSFVTVGIPALVFLAADQLFKWLAAVYLLTPMRITDWFFLRYEQNVGIAWSIFIPQPWLNILNVCLLLVLPLFIGKHIDLRRRDARFFLSLIIGGALGNLVDRLARGFVIDYIAVGTFPVFNLADSLLTVGIFLILVFYGRIHRDSRT